MRRRGASKWSRWDERDLGRLLDGGNPPPDVVETDRSSIERSKAIHPTAATILEALEVGHHLTWRDYLLRQSFDVPVGGRLNTRECAPSHTSNWPMMLAKLSGADVVLIAFAVRLVAIVIVLLVVAVVLFSSGLIPVSFEQPGIARHATIDWGCPSCDAWGAAYVNKHWREQARRRAIGLLHGKMSPECPVTNQDLLILS